ncbi:hypothetical protein [Sphingorhabdus sp.]|uniref:hypothetical protein n=1 Tax=Sphingorhabdus sp. TaxID=1902408 RepID=UPI0033421944
MKYSPKYSPVARISVTLPTSSDGNGTTKAACSRSQSFGGSGGGAGTAAGASGG